MPNTSHTTEERDQDAAGQVSGLEVWLGGKPYWEQYLWRICLDNDAIIEADLQTCFSYLREDLGLSEKKLSRNDISFKNEFSTDQNSESLPPVTLKELSQLKNVNAIPSESIFKFGPNLTVFYGLNGSGKSGIGRLLCNACFSRGERSILPNARSSHTSGTAGATFSFDKGGITESITYSLGSSIADLKRFSVFDCKSVLIHLDQSNDIKLTPGRIQVFDRIAEIITVLEEMLTKEELQNKKADPFSNMFLNEDSSIAQYCKGISASTHKDQLVTVISFDSDKDQKALDTLEKRLEEIKKLDVTKKKKELATERSALTSLKRDLLFVAVSFSEEKRTILNKLLADMLAKRELVKQLGAKSFDNTIIKTVGSDEWKSLLAAAKAIHDKEIEEHGHEPSICPLCNQSLGAPQHSLFQRYWDFLASKAEQELSILAGQWRSAKQELEALQASFPKFNETDAGIKPLMDADPQYLKGLQDSFSDLMKKRGEWLEILNTLSATALPSASLPSFSRIDEVVKSKQDEDGKLKDPTEEIKTITITLTNLQHKKLASNIIGQATAYLDFLKWQHKAHTCNFSSIKATTTRKRTEFFNEHAAQQYKGVFNEELRKLNCDFGLEIVTNGSGGNTVKNFRLDFATDYNPSQILSEGEQNACSLADFLTEVQLEPDNCGIVFDDPVTSLDHERKEVIAKRLSDESTTRQVIVFTHDIIFLSQLVSHSNETGTPVAAHWMRKIEGVPGLIDENTMPTLSALASNKKNAQDAIVGFSEMNAKDQEAALMRAYDFLRRSCEALVEEVLLAGTVRRYDDHIRMQNLEEMFFNQALTLQLSGLHGKISEVGFMHNRSDMTSGTPLTLDKFNELHIEFQSIEAGLRAGRKQAIKERDERKNAAKITS